MNRVLLIGRLTKDVELVKTPNGTSIAKFTLAVDNRGKDAGASFLNIVAFTELADLVSRCISKGSLVGIDGRISQRTYQTKDGTKASVVEIIADQVQFLEPKKEDKEERPASFTPEDAYENGLKKSTLDDMEDDLPF